MKEFKGRVVIPGEVSAEALVSKNGFNTLASMQMMFIDRKTKSLDQNNPDIYKKPIKGKALCLPGTIGSTTGGMMLFSAASLNRHPACLLFSKPIDSLAAAGSILTYIWNSKVSMPAIDCLGDGFLEYVQTGMRITIKPDGLVVVD